MKIVNDQDNISAGCYSNQEDDDQNITQLVADAQQGCASAQEELFAQLRNYLAFVANEHLDQQLKGKIGASDIVQETCVKAINGLGKYRGKTAAEFRGWLRMIIVNEVRQIKRGFNTDKRQVSREQAIAQDSVMSQDAIQLEDRFFTPGTEAIAEEQSLELKRVIEALPEETRQVIQLRNWEGLRFHEIAKRTGLSESKVAKIWYRGLIKIQEAFAGSDSRQ